MNCRTPARSYRVYARCELNRSYGVLFEIVVSFLPKIVTVDPLRYLRRNGAYCQLCSGVNRTEGISLGFRVLDVDSSRRVEPDDNIIVTDRVT